MALHYSKVVAFLAFASSTVTSASAQSSTNCIGMGTGMVHCDTMDMSQPKDDDDDVGTNLGLLIARMQENSLRKKIGKMLAAGDCRSAAKLAYEKGRLELGAQIARTCSPPSGR
jgi:hypothetical protein